jgi:hypothetical protein
MAPKFQKSRTMCWKKAFFFFIQKMAKIQDNVNPGHCEIQYWTKLKKIFKKKGTGKFIHSKNGGCE